MTYFLRQEKCKLVLELKRLKTPGIVVSTSDCHQRGPGFDSRLYPRNFSGSVGSGTGSTEPREDNLVSTLYEK